MNRIDVLRELLREAEDSRDVLRIEWEESNARFEKRLEVADAKVRGLSLALAEENGGEPEQAEAVPDWSHLPRTEAILTAMRFVDRPVGPSDISRIVRERGRTDTGEEISQSLQYLRKKKRPPVENRGRGRWVLVDHAEEEAPEEVT